MEVVTNLLSTEQASYRVGETIVVQWRLTHPIEDTVNNASVTAMCADEKRTRVAFLFGAEPQLKDGLYSVQGTVPTSAKPGLYFIAAPVLSAGGKTIAVNGPWEAPFFYVHGYLDLKMNHAEVHLKSRVIEEAQLAFARQALVVDEGALTQRFAVHIFAVGCLLTSRQQFAGFRIDPLNRGLDSRSVLDLVNSRLTLFNLKLPFDGAQDQNFQSGSPALVIEYENVRASSETRAMEFCRIHAHRLFQLLGMDRGQTPRECAVVAVSPDAGTFRWSFTAPYYRGNLIAGFDPTDTSSVIEVLLPKMAANPFLGLLVQTFGDAAAEQDRYMALFRYWTLLELVGDKYIPSDSTTIANLDGSPILKLSSNKPETQKSAVGRVYSYTVANSHFVSHHGYTRAGVQHNLIIGGQEPQPLPANNRWLSWWSMVRAAYAIRCAVAHEGRFVPDIQSANAYDRLAAELAEPEYALILHSLLRDQARFAISAEAARTP